MLSVLSSIILGVRGGKSVKMSSAFLYVPSLKISLHQNIEHVEIANIPVIRNKGFSEFCN